MKAAYDADEDFKSQLLSNDNTRNWVVDDLYAPRKTMPSNQGNQHGGGQVLGQPFVEQRRQEYKPSTKDKIHEIREKLFPSKQDDNTDYRQRRKDVSQVSHSVAYLIAAWHT